MNLGCKYWLYFICFNSSLVHQIIMHRLFDIHYDTQLILISNFNWFSVKTLVTLKYICLQFFCSWVKYDILQWARCQHLKQIETCARVYISTISIANIEQRTRVSVSYILHRETGKRDKDTRVAIWPFWISLTEIKWFIWPFDISQILKNIISF